MPDLDAVDMDIVWEIVSNDLPLLVTEIEQLIQTIDRRKPG